MTTFYPVAVSIALFTALILFDIIQRAPERINGHILFALITVFLMVYLSFKDMELVSWGLLLIPIVVLIPCYFLGVVGSSDKNTTHTPDTAPVLPTAPTSCQTTSDINTPDAMTAKKIVADNNLCAA
jgi:amino acid transporter